MNKPRTARELGGEAAEALVMSRDAGEIWFECFKSARGDVEGRIAVANEAYKAILDLARESKESRTLR
jgi:hypothetical protein